MKPNQDAYLWNFNFINEINRDKETSQKRVHLFGVFDGHGTHGKLVSNFIKWKLPSTINKYIEKGVKSTAEILIKSFCKVDSDLEKSKIDSRNSGSTWWVALIQDEVRDDAIVQEIYLANSGDSRAILCKFNECLNGSSIDSISVFNEVSQWNYFSNKTLKAW